MCFEISHTGSFLSYRGANVLTVAVKEIGDHQRLL